MQRWLVLGQHMQLAANRLLWSVMDFVILVGDNCDCGNLFNISGLATWKFQKTWHGNRQNSLQNLGHVGHIYSQLPFSHSSSAFSTIGEELASNFKAMNELRKFHIIAMTWTLRKFLKSGPEQIPRDLAPRVQGISSACAGSQLSILLNIILGDCKQSTHYSENDTRNRATSDVSPHHSVRHCGMRLQSGDRRQTVERHILATCFYSKRRAFDIARHRSTSFDFNIFNRIKTSKFRMDVSALRISP